MNALLFSYGTLQLEKVQLESFGRKLNGSKEILTGYKLEQLQIINRTVLEKSEQDDIRHFGTGMTTQEVESLSNNIDIEALKSYHEAVGEQTVKVFKEVSDIHLYEKLDKEYLHKVMIDEGVLHKNALWVEEFYQTKERAWFLVHMGLTHSFEHLGQIMLIRKLLGYKGTR